ncbi:MAG: hypothetical protein ABEJ72_01620, partial [Candidatus Aenigmatarchaeota archaeon]
PTSNPEGDGWYYIGSGKYTSFSTNDFTVKINKHNFSRTVKVPITITASVKGDQEGPGATQQLTQVRDYVFRIRMGRSLEPVPREEEEEEPRFWQETDPMYAEDGGDGKEDNNIQSGEESKKNVREKQDNSSESYKSGEKDQNIGEKGVNKVTILLILGIVASAGYIYRVL